MKKVLSLTMIITVTFACGVERMEVDPPRTLTLAVSEAENHPLVIGLAEFARLTEERTGKTLRIDVLSNKKAGEDRLVLGRLENGTLDLACVSSFSLSSLVKEFDALSFPLVFRDEGHFWTVLRGRVGDELLLRLEKKGIIGLDFIDPGALYFYSPRRELKAASDLSGLKARIPRSTVLKEYLDHLGAFVVPMPDNQISRALKTNVIDLVAVNIPAGINESIFAGGGFLLRYPLARPPAVLLASRASLARLPKEAREFLQRCAREAGDHERSRVIQSERDALTQMGQRGVKIIDAGAEDEYHKIAAALFENQPAEMKGLIEQIRRQ